MREGRQSCRTGAGLSPPLTSFSCPTIETYHHIFNYSPDAGAGSRAIAGLTGSAGWRAALFGTVAAGALLVSTPRQAKAGPAACVLSLGTATCTGDQSAGIASGVDFPASYTTLNVNSLTQNIAPAPGTSGIGFQGSTNVNITSNTNPFSISVTGSGANGINATAPGAITINHTGDITSTDGREIYAHSSLVGGSVYVQSSGTISAYRSGINANARGAVTVKSSGDITSTHRYGIFAYSYVNGGTVNVTSHGNINVYGTGIAASGGAAVTVNHTGDITSTQGEGLHARSFAGGDATVNQTGNINGDIEVRSYYGGNARATSSGTINAYENAITVFAFGNGGATVNSTGDITSTHNVGVYAYSKLGTVDVTSNGTIRSYYAGISAKGAGDVTINQTGDVTSTHGPGIYARSTAGNIAIMTQGGTVTGGSGYAGVNFVSGVTNTLKNYGTIQNASGISGLAVLGIPVMRPSPTSARSPALSILEPAAVPSTTRLAQLSIRTTVH